MKVNILWDSAADIRSGYLNLDSFADGKDERVFCEPLDLSPHLDEGEVEELVALEVLQHLPSPEIDKILEHWMSRLAHGGKIVVGCVDAYEVARAVWNGSLLAQKMNALLYGDQSKPSRYNCFSTTLEDLCRFFESRGYTVLKKRVTNFQAIVTAERP